MCRMLWTNEIWKSGQALGMLEDPVVFFEKLNLQALRVDSGSVKLKVQAFVTGLVCELSWLVYRNLSLQF